MIRSLRYGDTARLAEIAAAAYKGSAFDGIEVDPETFYRFIGNAVKGKSGWVAERNGRVEGVFIAGLHPLFFSKKLCAMNHLILVSDEGKGLGLKLVKHFIDWARNRSDVGAITLSATSGMPQQNRVEKLFEYFGEYLGSVYDVPLLEHKRNISGT